MSFVPPLSRKFASSAFSICVSVTIATLSFAVRLSAQGSEAQTPSVVEAARSARERAMSSGRHARIITTADLGEPSADAGSSTFSSQSSSTNAADMANPLTAGCDNPQAEKLKANLQAAQQELEQLRRDLQYNPPVVSGHDLDLQYFKPGNSGFDVGAPALLDAEPPGPARITEVELEERTDRLQKALRLACEPPEAARIQSAIDEIEQELNPLQRQFALDQEDYLSKPVTERIADNPQLDAEQQQIQALQAELQDLRQQLAALGSPRGPS
jgi:hypothetical protein